MHTKLASSPHCLSDRELVDRVKHLVCRERQATACLVAHLAELDERRLYLAEGCSCLFNYCVEVLHLSEHAAYNRIKVARTARTFPLVLERLARGSVNLTAVRLLSPVLTPENHRELLDKATHGKRQDVERLVARLRPSTAVASSVRKLPARAATCEGADGARSAAPVLDFSTANPDGAASQHDSSSLQGNDAESAPSVSAGNAIAGASVGKVLATTPTSHRARVAPLTADLYRVQFTADAETYSLLCQAKELLRHQVPDGDVAAVCGLALKVLVQKLSARKFGARKRTCRTDRDARVDVARPDQESGKEAGSHLPQRAGSRHIPAEVRRQVWSRDQGRCSFIGHNGQRCSERGRLEFHHLKPFAAGGAATVDNIHLRCCAHNQYEAELWFGKSEVVPERVENVISAPAG